MLTLRNPSLKKLTDWFYATKESKQAEKAPQQTGKTSQRVERNSQPLKGDPLEEETDFQEVHVETVPKEGEGGLTEVLVDVQEMEHDTVTQQRFVIQ